MSSDSQLLERWKERATMENGDRMYERKMRVLYSRSISYEGHRQEF